MTELSIAAGDTSVPLLERTISEDLDATIERFPDRDALVSPLEDIRLTYAGARRRGRPVGQGADRHRPRGR